MSEEKEIEIEAVEEVEEVEEVEGELFSKERTLQLGGYSPLPRIVRRAKGLSLAAKAVYALLVDYYWNSDEQSIRKVQEKMCYDLGDIDRNTLLKYLKELKNYGLITWERKGMPARNIYTLTEFPQSLIKTYPTQMRNKIPQQDTETLSQQDAEPCSATNIKVFKDQSFKDKTTTLSTYQTTAGDQGLTPAEVGVTEKVEEIKINKFLDYAKEMIIDPMYRGSPRRILVNVEETELTQLFIKQGWKQAKTIVDNTALKGRYGLDGLRMTMEDMGLLDNGKRNMPYQQFTVAPSTAKFNRSQRRESRWAEMNRELKRMTDDFIHQWRFSFSDEEKQQQIDLGYANDEGVPTPQLLKLWREGLEIVESNRDF